MKQISEFDNIFLYELKQISTSFFLQQYGDKKHIMKILMNNVFSRQKLKDSYF